MILPEVNFWFLRHGETDYNARGLSQGALDIDLNETGRAQARTAGLILRGRGITHIFSSPMRRTVETTDIVNEFLQLPVTYVPDLREVIFGGMEGQPLAPWFSEWMEGRATPVGAESFAELLARVAGVMPHILQTAGPLLIVAHGGVFRAIRDLMGMPRAGLTPNAVPLFCEHTPNEWRINAMSSHTNNNQDE